MYIYCICYTKSGGIGRETQNYLNNDVIQFVRA